MKPLFLALFMFAFFGDSLAKGSKKCNPNGQCNACTTCSACGHCAKGGGKCSVCLNVVSPNNSPTPVGLQSRKLAWSKNAKLLASVAGVAIFMMWLRKRK